MATVLKNQTMAAIAAKLKATTDWGIHMTAVDKQRLRFTALVKYTDGADSIEATLCSANGKPKTYGNADDCVREVARVAPWVSSLFLVFAMDPLSPESVSTNIAAVKAQQLNRAKTRAASQAVVLAKIDANLAEIATWNTGTAAQQAVFQKLTGERAVAAEQKAVFDADVTALSV